jgi:BirA family transcriptional regulator, biotin operon repressor / biotin---[acetyl-CoA-carboxylase] ligase
LAVTPSTQDIARRLAIGTCVVTDYQTAGRGRLSRRWEAPPQTALLASWVLPARPLALFAAGVATAEACGAAVRLKWPNDLLMGAAKLGGMLAEQRRDRCIVGIGINLHWSPPGGVSLGVDRDVLLDIISERLEHWFAVPDEEVLAAWKKRADTLGRKVRVDLGDEIFEGVAEDLASDGALVVSGRRVAAGDVVHLRPGSPPAPAAPAGSHPPGR